MVCPLYDNAFMHLYENGLVSILVCIMYATQSVNLKVCSEIIVIIIVKALSKLNECLFIVHQCDVKGCKENLVIDRSFDNNMECGMAKERLVGNIEYDSLPGLPGQIRMGCN